MKRIVINATQPEEVRVAMVDGQYLYDLDIEHPFRAQKKSNIYKGTITRVEPSLEAAFVNYGANRHGFLPFKEIAREYWDTKGKNISARPSIKEVIKEGLQVLVQVDKEERGNKGAALTTQISLAGRYLVLMPNNPRAGGVSRRINGEDRHKIRKILQQLDIPEGMGTIVRTAGVGRELEELTWDLEYLLTLWEAITTANKQHKPPVLLYQESNVIIRTLRDYFRKDVGEILIDNEQVYKQAHDFIQAVMPHNLRKLKHYTDPVPLFSRYQVEHQIESAFHREVTLPSGGAIVIDHTEALISIDVNSARATKGAGIEETALNTNLEAADEIARQLRLRDLGGLVVIDFIDMLPNRNQREVERRLREALKVDRARVQIGRVSRFGLLEMSRQRLRPSLGESTQLVCPRCSGQGTIRGVESLALSIMRLIEEEAMKDATHEVIAQTPVHVASFLLNEKRKALGDIQAHHKIKLTVLPNHYLETPHYEIQRIKEDDVEEGETRSYKQIIKPPEQLDSVKQVEGNQASVEAAVSNVTPATPSPIPQIEEPKAAPGLIQRIFGSLFGSKKVTEECKKEKNSKKKTTTKKQHNRRHNNPRHKNNNRANNQRCNNNRQNNKQQKANQQLRKKNKIKPVNRKQPQNKQQQVDKQQSKAQQGDQKQTIQANNKQQNNRNIANTQKNNQSPKQAGNKHADDNKQLKNNIKQEQAKTDKQAPQSIAQTNKLTTQESQIETATVIKIPSTKDKPVNKQDAVQIPDFNDQTPLEIIIPSSSKPKKSDKKTTTRKKTTFTAVEPKEVAMKKHKTQADDEESPKKKSIEKQAKIDNSASEKTQKSAKAKTTTRKKQSVGDKGMDAKVTSAKPAKSDSVDSSIDVAVAKTESQVDTIPTRQTTEKSAKKVTKTTTTHRKKSGEKKSVDAKVAIVIPTAKPEQSDSSASAIKVEDTATQKTAKEKKPKTTSKIKTTTTRRKAITTKVTTAKPVDNKPTDSKKKKVVKVDIENTPATTKVKMDTDKKKTTPVKKATTIRRTITKQSSTIASAKGKADSTAETSIAKTEVAEKKLVIAKIKTTDSKKASSKTSGNKTTSSEALKVTKKAKPVSKKPITTRKTVKKTATKTVSSKTEPATEVKKKPVAKVVEKVAKPDKKATVTSAKSPKAISKESKPVAGRKTTKTKVATKKDSTKASEAVAKRDIMEDAKSVKRSKAKIVNKNTVKNSTPVKDVKATEKKDIEQPKPAKKLKPVVKKETKAKSKKNSEKVIKSVAKKSKASIKKDAKNDPKPAKQPKDKTKKDSERISEKTSERNTEKIAEETIKETTKEITGMVKAKD
jgi:ribonuclease E